MIPSRFLPFLLLVFLSLVWGSSFILIKKALLVYTPLEVGAARLVTAALVLLPLVFRDIKKLSLVQWKKLFVTGTVGSFFPAFFFAFAQTNLESSLAGVLNAITPIFVIITGSLFFGNAIKRTDAMGVAIGFAGTLLLMFAGGAGLGGFNMYALLILAATICYGININYINHSFKLLSARQITTFAFFTIGGPAAIILFAGTGFVEKVATAPGAWLALLYVVILGAVGTALALILFNRLVKITGPVFTSFVTYFIPIVAVAWGLIDGETLYLQHYLGMALILAGIYVVNRERLKRRKKG